MWSKQQTFSPPVASVIPPGAPICGTGLSSGCWHTCALTHVMHPVNNWANNKRTQRASLQSDRGSEGVSKVSCFLKAIFFNQASKVNIPTNLQPSECRLNESERKWREMERKWQKKEDCGELFFPPEKLMFHRFGFPSFGSPHAYSYLSG